MMPVQKHFKNRVDMAQSFEFVAVYEHRSDTVGWIRENLTVVIQDVHCGSEVVYVAWAGSPAQPDGFLIIPVRKCRESEHDVPSHRRKSNAHGANHVLHVCHSDSGM